MLKDISFGQYYPTGSIIHKIDPRMKLVLLIAYIVFVFLTFNAFSLTLMTVFTFFVLFSSKIPLKIYLKNLKIILPIIIFTSILNALYITEGTELVSFGFIHIYDGGIYRAIFMSVRILVLILISSVLSYTATPTELTDAIESLLSPLKHIGLGGAVHSMAMMMTIALRFIPTLIEETDKIMSSQKARGASLESGGLLKRIKALLPILIPLLISSIRRAYELAEAMESRCYNGGKGRVRMKQLHLAARDYVTAAIVILLFTAVILLNIFL